MANTDSPKLSHDSLAKKLTKAQHEKNHISIYDPVIMPKDPYDRYQPSVDISASEDQSIQIDDNPKSVKELFHRFSDNTTIQGLHFITTATKWHVKTLWSLIFIAAVATWLLHSIVLINKYIQYDTNSKVKFAYEALEFPTVTFCNINPIRKSMSRGFGSDDLVDFLDRLRPRTNFRDQGQNQDQDQGQRQGQGRGQGRGQGQSQRQGRSQDRVQGQGRGQGQGQGQGGDRGRGQNEGRGQGQGGRQGRDVVESDNKDNKDRTDYVFQPFADITWSDYRDVGAFADFLDGGDYASSVLAKYLVREMIVDLPDENRTNMGHRLADMMLGCTFDGATCSKLNISFYQDISYGNCFSFNSQKLRENALISTDSGSNLGLDMILYIQQHEYLWGLDQGRGLRLYVHPFGTQPFVEDSGVSVPTGFQTYVGLRQVSQVRLGGKYGDCGDNGEYERYYEGEYTYTLDACSRTCLDRQISKNCGCFRGPRKQFYSESDRRGLYPCRSPAELTCVDDVKNDINEEKLHCNCKQECRMTNYDYLFSYDNWPDPNLWHSLVSAVCETATPSNCKTIKQEEDRETFLRRNFIHLKIYYRDLNIEQIEEVASYEDIQFYSDMGGAIGLWLGATVITIFELGDFFIRCIGFCCKRKTPQNDSENMGHNTNGTISHEHKRTSGSVTSAVGTSNRSTSLPTSLQSTPRQLRRFKESDFPLTNED